MKSYKAIFTFLQYLRLIRTTHWIKNLAIFLPSFFSGEFFDLVNSPSFFDFVILFVVFCLTSSAIYVFNDIVDAAHDRLHPIKKKRPIANDIISKRNALYIGITLCTISVVLLTQVGESGLFVLAYFLLNILYVLKLRRLPILDVVSISIGFLLRIFAGGMVAGIEISHWMIVVVFLLSSSLGFAKRRDELVLMNGQAEIRGSLSGYNIAFLDIAKTIGFTVTLMAYLLYSVSDEVTARFNTDKLYITSLFVFLGILRYLQLSIVKNNTGEPVRVLLTDFFMQVIILLWGLSFMFIIYGEYIF